MLVVKNDAQLKDALKNESYELIVIEEGVYFEDHVISLSGVADKKREIRAAGNPVFKNNIITITGSGNILYGCVFKNGMVVVRGSHNRVVKNVFEDGQPGGNSSRLHSAVAIEGDASFNLVDHNEVTNWQRRALRNIKLTEKTKANVFSRNYLHGLIGENNNSGEAFQVGSGPNDQPYFPACTVEYNLVDGFNIDSEIISLKSSDNLVRFNTFKDCEKSSVSIRAGSKNKIVGNTLIKVLSINVYGDDNRILGNELTESRIDIRSGDCTFTELVTSDTYNGGHPSAIRTVVVGNILHDSDIRLGKKGTGKITYNRIFPAEGTILANNEGGKVFTDGAVKDTDERASYEINLRDVAHELTEQDVGLAPILDDLRPPQPEPSEPEPETEPVVEPKTAAFYITCEYTDDIENVVSEITNVYGVKKVVTLEDDI